MGPKAVWRHIQLFINQKVCKCSAGGRAEKLGKQVSNTRLSSFQFGKEPICYIHTHHFYQNSIDPNRFHKIDQFDLLINKPIANCALCTCLHFVCTQIAFMLSTTEVLFGDLALLLAIAPV